MVVTDVTLSVD